MFDAKTSDFKPFDFKNFDPKAFGFSPEAYTEALKAFSPEGIRAAFAKLPGLDLTSEPFAAGIAARNKATEMLVRDSRAAVEAWSTLVTNQVAFFEDTMKTAFAGVAPAPKSARAVRTAKARA